MARQSYNVLGNTFESCCLGLSRRRSDLDEFGCHTDILSIISDLALPETSIV